MKVLLLNKFFHPKGGCEQVFFQERAFLGGHAEVVDFSMAHPDNLPSPYADYFVPCVDYHGRGGPVSRLAEAARFIRSGPAIQALKRLIRDHGPFDVAHAHNIYHQITPSVLPLLKKSGAKVVLTLHDYKVACPAYTALNKGRPCLKCLDSGPLRVLSEHCQSSRGREALLAAEALFHKARASYGAVDAFVAPSAFMAGVARRALGHGAVVEVAPNGVDMDAFSPARGPGTFALYAGRLSREKGLETLMQAHDSMAGDMPLKIAGDGPLMDALAPAPPPGVEFLGRVDPKGMRALYREAAFVVVPSRWYENCSMTVIEAMASGRAVVATRAGGLPEQVEQGRTGLLVPMGDAGALADAMRSLARDPDTRMSMGRAGREKAVGAYSLDRHNRALLDLYQRIASSKG